MTVPNTFIGELPPELKDLRQLEVELRANPPTEADEHCLSELETSMSSVQIEQKSYEMPPREGISIAQFLTVADIERSARYYERSSALAF